MLGQVTNFVFILLFEINARENQHYSFILLQICLGVTLTTIDNTIFFICVYYRFY